MIISNYIKNEHRECDEFRDDTLHRIKLLSYIMGAISIKNSMRSINENIFKWSWLGDTYCFDFVYFDMGLN